MKTGIIIPCYNEEKRINTKAFLDFITVEENFHLCFVNDGSTDNTMKVLNEMKNKFPLRISVVDIKQNKGKAAAVKAGATYLFNRVDASYVGYLDADLSTDFKDFKLLVDKLKSDHNLSLVFGSRSISVNGIERNPLRGLFSKVIKTFIYGILRLPIKDTQCGAKVFTREIIPVIFKSDFICRWLFDVEIFLRMKSKYGRKNVMNYMKEKALLRWVHADDSKLGMKDALQIPYRLINIWLAYSLINVFKTPTVKVLKLDSNRENLVFRSAA
ncbi:glycosyltransferase [Ascidiimonas sp. W6]|uniref:glycosyltransferase n=1 Tax=Ascidiimonas meishanensis TaxID=3128903 RepID=UPI0030EEE09C